MPAPGGCVARQVDLRAGGVDGRRHHRLDRCGRDHGEQAHRDDPPPCPQNAQELPERHLAPHAQLDSTCGDPPISSKGLCRVGDIRGRGTGRGVSGHVGTARVPQRRRRRVARTGAGPASPGPPRRRRVGCRVVRGWAPRRAVRRALASPSSPHARSAPTRPSSSTTRVRCGGLSGGPSTSSTSTRSPSPSRPPRSCCSGGCAVSARPTCSTPPRTSTSATPSRSAGSSGWRCGTRAASTCATRPPAASSSARASRVGPAPSTSAPTSPSSHRRAYAVTPSGEVPVVGFAGRLDAAKGADVLLRAVALEPGLRVRLAGDGPERPRLVAAGGSGSASPTASSSSVRSHPRGCPTSTAPSTCWSSRR